MFITGADPGDVPILVEKMGHILGKLYEPGMILVLVAHWPRGCLVIRHGNDIAGFLIGVREENGSARVLSLGIEDRFRRKGLGKRLMKRFRSQCVMENIRVIRLEMAVNNTAARKFYENMGFFIERRVSLFYEDGKDAYSLMRYV